MWRTFLWFTVFVSLGSGMAIGFDWYSGVTARWFVWSSAILFNVNVALGCIADLASPA